MFHMFITLSGVQVDNHQFPSSVRGFRLLATGKEINQSRIGLPHRIPLSIPVVYVGDIQCGLSFCIMQKHGVTLLFPKSWQHFQLNFFFIYITMA